MSHDAYPSYPVCPSDPIRPAPRLRGARRRIRNRCLLALALAGLGGGGLAGLSLRDARSPEPARFAEAEAVDAVRVAPKVNRPGLTAYMLDPRPSAGAMTGRFVPEAPAAALFAQAKSETPPVILAQAPQAAPAETPRPQAAPGRDPSRSAAPITASIATPLPPRRAEPVRLAEAMPTPPPRPSELRRPRPSETPRAVARTRFAAVATAREAEEERSFFDTVFGAKPAETPAEPETTGSIGGSSLAYAPADGGLGGSPVRPLVPAPVEARVAVYDISAQRVYLPNGEVLEAHSGLGPSMDNPAHVHLRMRGATPPGTYDLREREALFHGVRALRLNPVGGPGAIHGRVGLLTHTYMLGSSGASNGCISFRNYPRFLQAFLRGEVNRVVVVAEGGQDQARAYAGGRGRRTASAN